MLGAVVFAAVLAAAAARPLRAQESYAAWAAEFSTAGTIFEGSEARFSEALKEIAAHNADRSQTWQAGVNKFTAMTKVSAGGRPARRPAPHTHRAPRCAVA